MKTTISPQPTSIQKSVVRVRGGTHNWLLFYFLTCCLSPTRHSNYMLGEGSKESRTDLVLTLRVCRLLKADPLMICCHGWLWVSPTQKPHCSTRGLDSASLAPGQLAFPQPQPRNPADTINLQTFRCCLLQASLIKLEGRSSLIWPEAVITANATVLHHFHVQVLDGELRVTNQFSLPPCKPCKGSLKPQPPLILCLTFVL